MALPRGTGKTVRVAVVADGQFAQDAREAGADVVGYEDVVQKIKDGWQDFDILIATPDAMRLVRPLGRQLGPRGLMPEPEDRNCDRIGGNGGSGGEGWSCGVPCRPWCLCPCSVRKDVLHGGSLKENFDVIVDALNKAKPTQCEGHVYHLVHGFRDDEPPVSR